MLTLTFINFLDSSKANNRKIRSHWVEYPKSMTSLSHQGSTGGVAQLVEHLTGSQKVVGSSPITSTKGRSLNCLDPFAKLGAKWLQGRQGAENR